jgi:hypothetical protein
MNTHQLRTLLFAAVASTFMAWSTAAAERFQLTSRALMIPERGEVPSCVITMETNEVSFVPPPTWRVRSVPQEKTVSLSDPDGRVIINLKFIHEPSGKRPELKLETLRQQIKDRFPEAKVLEELNCYSPSGSGPAFDVERSQAGRVPLISRLGFIPLPGYLLEFEGTCPTNQFKQSYSMYSGVLTSLRFGPLPPPK